MGMQPCGERQARIPYFLEGALAPRERKRSQTYLVKIKTRLFNNTQDVVRPLSPHHRPDLPFPKDPTLFHGTLLVRLSLYWPATKKCNGLAPNTAHVLCERIKGSTDGGRGRSEQAETPRFRGFSGRWKGHRDGFVGVYRRLICR